MNSKTMIGLAVAAVLSCLIGVIYYFRDKLPFGNKTSDLTGVDEPNDPNSDSVPVLTGDSINIQYCNSQDAYASHNLCVWMQSRLDQAGLSEPILKVPSGEWNMNPQFRTVSSGGNGVWVLPIPAVAKGVLYFGIQDPAGDWEVDIIGGDGVVVSESHLSAGKIMKFKVV